MVPQKTGNAVPRSGRMKDFREGGRPANVVVLRSGERSSASLGGGRKTVDSLSESGAEKGFAARDCGSKSSRREEMCVSMVPLAELGERK